MEEQQDRPKTGHGKLATTISSLCKRFPPRRETGWALDRVLKRKKVTKAVQH